MPSSKPKYIVVLSDVTEKNVYDLEGQQECYSTLTKACNAHDWNYNEIVKKKLPIIKDGWLINRINLK